MSDNPVVENETAFPRAAIWLSAGLLLALLVALTVAGADNGRRAALETTAEFTAVGDTHYFPMPKLPSAPSVASAPSYPAVAFLHGKPLYLTDYRRHEEALDDMARVGVTDQGGYIVYGGLQLAKDDDDRQLGPVYYLKISPTEFLKTRQSQ